MRCRNGHEVELTSGPAQVCPTCGAKLAARHPLLLGLGFGFLSCIVVSYLELAFLSYTNSSPWAWEILLGAVPAVFLLSGGLGAVYLKARYGNLRGLGKVFLGTLPPFLVFLFLWAGLLLILALLGCAGGGC